MTLLSPMAAISSAPRHGFFWQYHRHQCKHHTGLQQRHPCAGVHRGLANNQHSGWDENFMLQGLLDDPTATVVVNAGGNNFPGLVEDVRQGYGGKSA